PTFPSATSPSTSPTPGTTSERARARAFAHSRRAPASGLGEDDEGAGVVVEEVPAADGREFPVAEESDERKFAQALADQRHVVIGHAEEPAAAPGAVEVAAEGRPPTVQALGQLVEHLAQVLARRPGVADLELQGLPYPHALGDGQGTARLIGADEVSHEEVAAPERRL